MFFITGAVKALGASLMTAALAGARAGAGAAAGGGGGGDKTSGTNVSGILSGATADNVTITLAAAIIPSSPTNANAAHRP
jgi:hypothetical protein